MGARIIIKSNHYVAALHPVYGYEQMRLGVRGVTGNAARASLGAWQSLGEMRITELFSLASSSQAPRAQGCSML